MVLSVLVGEIEYRCQKGINKQQLIVCDMISSLTFWGQII